MISFHDKCIVNCIQYSERIKLNLILMIVLQVRSFNFNTLVVNCN